MELAQLTADNWNVLQHCFLFQGLTKEQTAQILKHTSCRCCDFAKGAAMEGEARLQQSVGFVLSGKVTAYHVAAGHKFRMQQINAGSAFGAAALFCDSTDYVTQLRAATNCRIIFLPKPLIEASMQENYAMAENYIRFLSDRVRFLNRKIQTLITPDANAALASFLMSNCQQTDSQCCVKLSVGVATLAEMLNLSRASLYRAFDALESQGLIQRSGKQITVLKYDALSRLI